MRKKLNGYKNKNIKTMNKKELVRLVRHEAKALRRNLSGEQKRRLNFNKLNPNNSSSCIYGQITGYCHNTEAIRLIKKCASRIYHSGYGGLENVSRNPANGGPSNYRTTFWSPIEAFIAVTENKSNGNNKALVDFIKGEINELNFK